MNTVQQWGVGVVSNSSHDSAVVTSMLNLLKANTGDRWNMVRPEDAHFLLVSSDAAVPERAEAAPPRVLARLVEPGEPAPGDVSLLIRRPIRPMPFLELLHEVDTRLRELVGVAEHNPAELIPTIGDLMTTLAASDDRLEASTQPMAPNISDTVATVQPSGVQPPLALGWCLQSARKDGNSSTIVLLDRDESELAAINMSRAAFASAHPFAELVTRIEKSFWKAEMRPLSDWKAFAGNKPEPLDLLCWHVGKIIGRQTGLAPWLNAEQSYRLVSWPNFGVIGSDRAGIKLSAHLAHKCVTAQQLGSASSLDLGTVYSFLNSTSLCGLLVAGQAGQASPRTAGEALAGPEQRSMMARLRNRLGL